MGSRTGRGIQWIGDRNPTQICNETSIRREKHQVSCVEAGVKTAVYLLYFVMCVSVCVYAFDMFPFLVRYSTDIVHESNCKCNHYSLFDQIIV